MKQNFLENQTEQHVKIYLAILFFLEHTTARLIKSVKQHRRISHVLFSRVVNLRKQKQNRSTDHRQYCRQKLTKKCHG